MTDISKEAVDALIPLLNYGVCQDQYDDVEIYETEQLMKKAAQSLAALRAALDEAEARAVKAEALAPTPVDLAPTSLDEALAVPTEEAFMSAVWDALKADASDLRKQQSILKAFRAALRAIGGAK